MKIFSFFITNLLFSIIAINPVLLIVIVLNLPVNPSLNDRMYLLFFLIMPVFILFCFFAFIKRFTSGGGPGPARKEVFYLNLLFAGLFTLMVLVLSVYNIFIYSGFFKPAYYLIAGILIINQLFLVYYLYYSKYHGPEHPISIVTVMLIPFIFLFCFLSIQPAISDYDEIKTPLSSYLTHKTVIFCIDGLSSNILDEYTDEKNNGFFCNARDKGIYKRLQTIFPTHSPVIWTTVASGETPLNHGIIGFGRYRFFGAKSGGFSIFPKFMGMSKYFYLLSKAGIAAFYPNMSYDVRVPRIWDIMSSAGFSLSVINYPVTLPPSIVNGAVISETEFITNFDSLAFESIYPPEIKSDITEFLKNTEPAAHEMFSRQFRDILAGRDRYSAELAERFFVSDFKIMKMADKIRSLLKPESNVDIIYIHGLDGSSHLFFDDFFNKINKGNNPGSTYLGKYLGFIEKEIEDYLKNYGEDCTVFILSDHGFESKGFIGSISDPLKPYLQGIHENAPDGVFMAYGKDIDRDKCPGNLSVYDITPTLLFYFGLPVSDDFAGTPHDIFKVNRQIRHIESYRALERNAFVKRIKIEEEELRENENMLKSLGYIN